MEVEHTNIIKSNKVNKRNFTEQNIRHFVTSLQTVDWSSIEITASTQGPDAAYTQFANLYKSVYATAFPIISSDVSRRSSGPKQPWMTSALFKSCKKKNKLYKIYLKNPTLQNKSNFNKYRNKFKILKTETIRIYYAECFALCANDLKKPGA